MHAPYTHTDGLGAGGVVRQPRLQPVQAELLIFFFFFSHLTCKWGLERIIADKSKEAVKGKMGSHLGTTQQANSLSVAAI